MAFWMASSSNPNCSNFLALVWTAAQLEYADDSCSLASLNHKSDVSMINMQAGSTLVQCSWQGARKLRIVAQVQDLHAGHPTICAPSRNFSAQLQHMHPEGSARLALNLDGQLQHRTGTLDTVISDSYLIR